MPLGRISNFLTFKHLEIEAMHQWPTWQRILVCRPKAEHAFCTKCGVLSQSIYDHRIVEIKDAPIRQFGVLLRIRKRRFFCQDCRKPFTERLPGILPRKRVTERYCQNLLWACETFSDLKSVTRHFRCSFGFLYLTLYRHLDLRLRRLHNYPWPKNIGIDEHGFQKRRKGSIPFASLIVDYVNKKPYKLLPTKIAEEMCEKLKDIPGRENVQNAVMDLCDPYKKFVRLMFPNAHIIADKFHVLRLLHPAINKRRKLITGDKRTLKIRKLLLANAARLDYFDKAEILDFLNDHPELKEIWITQQKMHALYRCKGIDRARLALNNLLKQTENSQIYEIQKLRRTLWKWSKEILRYFITGLTNARTEAFNNVASLVRKRGFGYRSFRNYELRLLCRGLR